MKPLTIGQVAKQVGIGVETLRFYERQGLLAQPKRPASGYRQYDDEAVERLGFIRRAKALGFTLGEIRSLLSLRVDPHSTVADVRERARKKVEEVDAKIRDLTAIRDALRKLVKACRGDGPKSECPILEALDPSNHRTRNRQQDRACHESH